MPGELTWYAEAELEQLMGHPCAGWLYQGGRLLVATVFLWSGLSKALQPQLFAETVAAYGLLPPGLIFPAALALIGGEIVAALGLLLEKRGALTAITLMLLLFLGVLGYGIQLGLDIDCGCFGADDPEALAFHDLRGAFFRDLLILLAIGYLYAWRFFNGRIPRPWGMFGVSLTNKEDKG